MWHLKLHGSGQAPEQLSFMLGLAVDVAGQDRPQVGDPGAESVRDHKSPRAAHRAVITTDAQALNSERIQQHQVGLA